MPTATLFQCPICEKNRLYRGTTERDSKDDLSHIATQYTLTEHMRKAHDQEPTNIEKHKQELELPDKTINQFEEKGWSNFNISEVTNQESLIHRLKSYFK